MLAVVISVEGVGWDSLPDWYRFLPSFNMDLEFNFTINADAIEEVIRQAASDCETQDVRSDTISIIKEIQNDIYMVSDQVLETIMPLLQQSKENLKRGMPTGSDLPTTRIPLAKNRRTNQKQQTQPTSSCPTEPHDDIIEDCK